jgi:putative membrane protein
VRARRGNRDAGWDRALLFGAALLVGVAGLVLLHGPAERYASAHMLQHVLLGDLAVALALVALRGPLFFAFVPRPLRRALRLRAVRALLRPWPSLAVWGALLYLWHVPALYGLALQFHAVHTLQHASFILGGCLVWMQLIDPARRRLLGLWGSLGYAFAVMVVAQPLVAMLILSYRPLYPAYEAQGAFGMTPLADQNLAALVMAVEMFLVLGTYALIRLRTFARSPFLVREGHPLGT